LRHLKLKKTLIARPITGVSHGLVRGCVVAVFLTYGSGGLFAWARDEEVGSSAQVDYYMVDDKPSAYALVWSYFSSLMASDSSGAALQYD
jgi:hypothetical protein